MIFCTYVKAASLLSVKRTSLFNQQCLLWIDKEGIAEKTVVKQGFSRLHDLFSVTQSLKVNKIV
jgi:hypothetical protein